MERDRLESFEGMSSNHVAPARTLARASVAIGFLYLARVVPG